VTTEAKKDNSRAVAKAPAGLPATDLGVAQAMVSSGFFPNVKSASQALVKIYAGRELGFGPVSSMMGIHVIVTGKGSDERTTIQLSANMIATLVRRSGIYDFQVTKHDDEQCIISFYRDHRHIGTSEFNLKLAAKAGLAERPVWRAWPRNMLFAAAMRNGAKWFCSEVMLGVPVPVAAGGDGEERADQEMIEGERDTDILVDADGVIVEEPSVPVVTEPPEGYEPNWPEFWASARELGLAKPEVHAIFGVPEEDGELKKYAEARGKREGKPMPQVVAEMLTDLKASKTGAASEDVGAPVGEDEWESMANKGEAEA